MRDCYGFGVQFSDPSGLLHFPVDGARIRQAQIAITTYEPRNHFTQQLVIPEIRLSDWETQNPNDSQSQGTICYVGGRLF